MREYAKISCSLWNSRKFRNLPSDDDKLLYLYLHTSPHVNMVGCYVLLEEYALADLRWKDEDGRPDVKRYRKAIESLSIAGLIGFDSEESLVRIVDFLLYDPFTNPKHAAGALKTVFRLPDCAERQRLLVEMAKCKHAKQALKAHPIDSLSKAYRNPEPEPEPEPEQEPLGGGGSARERETLPALPDDPTLRERILVACGADPVTGLTGPNGKTLGTRADMHVVERWQSDLGLDAEAIMVVIRDVMAGKCDGPPSRLTYFTKAMQREAARRTEPRLEPINDPDPDHAGQPRPYRSGGSRAHENLAAGFARAISKLEG